MQEVTQMADTSSWTTVDRVAGISDTEIVARIRLDGQPVPGLANCPHALARSELRRVLSSAYVPSNQVLTVVRKALGMLDQHFKAYYASLSDYRLGIGSAISPLPPSLPMCLTGLPGVGKTQMLAGLMRLLEGRIEVDLGPGYRPVTLALGHHVKVTAANSLVGIVKDVIFGHGEASGAMKLSELRKLGGRKLYRDGRGLVALDEMQLIARGTNASTNLNKLLLTCADFGVPQIHASNFLNVAKIKRSGKEITDRLLVACEVMTPEPENDPAEVEMRRVYEKLTKGVVPKSDAFWSALNELSFRIHRTRIELLSLAFERARLQQRHRIEYEDLLVAAQTADYAINLEQVRVLSEMSISGKAVKGYQDLVCPFGVRFAFPPDAQRKAETVARRDIEEEAVRSSMTPQEHRGMEAMQGKESDATKKVRARKAPKFTFEALVASAESAR